MKIYKMENVYEAAKKRIERLFDEFDNVIVSFSGGKDSTVCLELALEVARQKGRLPLPVLFIDQEAEWQHTIDYVKEVMYRKEVKPYWVQCPIKLFNASSFEDDWLQCWDPAKKDKWIHPQGPIAITENVFGTDRFKKMFEKVNSWIFNGEVYANIGGVRAQENVTRYSAVTNRLCYKDITWGKKEPKGYTFYPIYDWTSDDDWIYIAKNHLKYNKVYDLQFNYGVRMPDMRVSNLHHETATSTIMLLQEVERNTYNRLCERLSGISTFSQIQKQAINVDELPEMFTDWKEYRDYLLVHLIPAEHQDNFRSLWKGQEDEDWYKHHVGEILRNDWTGTTNANMKSRRAMQEKSKNGKFEKLYERLHREDEEE